MATIISDGSAPSGGGGSSSAGPTTLYTCDYIALGDAALDGSGDGTYAAAVDGKDAYVLGTASTDSIALDSAGLTLDANATGTGIWGFAASFLLSDLSASFNVNAHWRITARIAENSDANYESCGIRVVAANALTDAGTTFYAIGGAFGSGNNRVYTQRGNAAGEQPLAPTGLTAPDTIILEHVAGSVAVYLANTGGDAGDLPASSSGAVLVEAFQIEGSTAAHTGLSNTNAMLQWIGFTGAGQTSNTFVASLEALKIEQWS